MLQALKQRFDPAAEFSISTLEAFGGKTYELGKWTIKDILQHMIDMERVFAYRAMRFSRNDHTPLSGFKEDIISRYTFAEQRSIGELLSEYALLQKCTLVLYSSFNETMLSRFGIASGNQISVLALGFLIAGHANHHVNVIREKYLPLA